MNSKVYAASLCARKDSDEHFDAFSKYHFRALHTVVIIKANGEEEALGKGYNRAFELFPKLDGYREHSVIVKEIENG